MTAQIDLKKLRYKKLELQFLNPIVGCCQGIFRRCKSGVQLWLLNFFCFSRNCVFCDFIIFFSKKDILKI